jgi:hypothetical protein
MGISSFKNLLFNPKKVSSMENTIKLFENPISISTLIEMTNKTLNDSISFLEGVSCFESGPVMPNN